MGKIAAKKPPTKESTTKQNLKKQKLSNNDSVSFPSSSPYTNAFRDQKHKRCRVGVLSLFP